jgi:hypothetical protein
MKCKSLESFCRLNHFIIFILFYLELPAAVPQKLRSIAPHAAETPDTITCSSVCLHEAFRSGATKTDFSPAYLSYGLVLLC